MEPSRPLYWIVLGAVVGALLVLDVAIAVHVRRENVGLLEHARGLATRVVGRDGDGH